MNQAKEGLHFHHPSKGCKIEDRVYNRLTGGRWAKVAGSYCSTHKKEICRCGNEFGWHGGTYSNPQRIRKGTWSKLRL